MANQYTKPNKKVPWNKEYNKDKINKYFVKRMPDGKVYAIMSNDEIVKPIKVLVEQPQDPKDWRQKIKEAFQKCDKIWEDFMHGKSMVDYKTEKTLKKKPFWNVFSRPIKSFWNLLKKI